MRDNEEADIEITCWKKSGLIILIFSEIGLSPFLAEAIGDTIDIISKLVSNSPANSALKYSIGYGLAVPYVITAMLSVGNINQSVKALFANDQAIYNISNRCKKTQQIIIGSSFIIGSLAAAVGVIHAWGNSAPFYVLAAYTFTGQVIVVLLQANKRIVASAASIMQFLGSDNKCEIIKMSCSKAMLGAIINTFSNMLYWGSFYYFIGANISEIFSFDKVSEIISSLIFCMFGSYMAFCTQGIDELSLAYRKSRYLLQNEINDEEQIYNPNCLSLLLTLISFSCRLLATASFSYTLMNGETITQGEFAKNIGIAALVMLLPGASSAYQYVKYIHNQVNDGIKGIKENIKGISQYLDCKRLTFFCRNRNGNNSLKEALPLLEGNQVKSYDR